MTPTPEVKEIAERWASMDAFIFAKRYPDAWIDHAKRDISSLITWLGTEQEMHAAWRKRAEEAEAAIREAEQLPVPMLMFCPRCTTQHVDAPEPESGWTNPPHATHTCKACGLNWRPSNHNTVGVESISVLEEKHKERIEASKPVDGRIAGLEEAIDSCELLRQSRLPVRDNSTMYESGAYSMAIKAIRARIAELKETT